MFISLITQKNSAAISTEKSAEAKVILYLPISIVRPDPSPRLSSSVAVRKSGYFDYVPLSSENEGTQDAQVLDGDVLLSSCRADPKCSSFSKDNSFFAVSSFSVFGNQSPRNLRSYWCALSPV